MKNIVAVYDKDISFAKKICDHLKSNDTILFSAFSDLKVLRNYEKENNISLIIVSNDANIDRDDFKCKRIVMLTENKDNVSIDTIDESKNNFENDKIIRIYKYQSIDSLAKQITLILNKFEENNVKENIVSNCAVFAMYSPVSSVKYRKNFFNAAINNAKNKKALYISIREMDLVQNRKNFSNIIYYYKSKELSKEKIESQIDNKKDIDLINGVAYPDDLSLVSPFDLEEIINTIVIEMKYEQLYLDLDNSYIKNEYLLKKANQIIIPLSKDTEENAMVNKFKKYIKKDNSIDSKIIKIVEC